MAPISASAANAIIKRLHYSGKVVQNSQLHFGVFWGGYLEGAMQFGPSLDKRKLIGLVSGTGWNEFIELNRMAFSDALPRNSESRAISVAMRLIRKKYPHLKWVVSFADGTQCGDGTIYRASGFVLTGISESMNLAVLPNGDVVHKMTLESNPTSQRAELGGEAYFSATNGRYNFRRYAEIAGAKILPGYQLRYVYFLDPSARERLTVPLIPFSEIERRGARMYCGKRVASDTGDTAAPQAEKGGSIPTATLQKTERK